MRPDPFRALLSRVLPWFNQAHWDRERAATRRVIARANAELVRSAYRDYGTRLNGH